MALVNTIIELIADRKIFRINGALIFSPAGTVAKMCKEPKSGGHQPTIAALLAHLKLAHISWWL